MNKPWRLEVSVDQQGRGALNLCLDLVQDDSGLAVRLLADCPSLEEFERGLEDLKSDMAGQLERSLEEARELSASEEGPGEEDQPESPEEIWETLESLPEEGFFDYFNGLAEEKRRQVAEYVFSQASMFKGKGPLFAARFDRGSGMLH